MMGHMKKPKYKKVTPDSAGISLYKYPETIQWTSTGEMVQFLRFSPRSTHRKYYLYVYIYTECSGNSGKLGTELPLKEEDIEWIISKQIANFSYDESSGE